MRHPKEGAPLVAAINSGIPVINAGDGGHQHPTQTLTDLMTIKSLTGKLSNITIGLCGDLKFGRTVHSLINSLVRYEGIKFVLISPKELRVPDYIRDDVIKANNVEFVELENLEDAMPELDVLYMTRIQQERLSDRKSLIHIQKKHKTFNFYFGGFMHRTLCIYSSLVIKLFFFYKFIIL